jgi:predicted transcriptional regulator
MNFGIIYKATNIENGKVYIGQTVKSLNERKYNHFKTARSNTTHKHFASALKKWGNDNFIWEEIDHADTKGELDEKEVDWIWFHNSTNRNHGYNKSVGGHSHQRLNVKYASILLYRGFLIKEICEKLNCDKCTVISRLSSYLGKNVYTEQVKVNRRKHPPEIVYNFSKEQFQELIDQHASTHQMAKTLKVSRTTIKNNLIKLFGMTFYKEMSQENNKQRLKYIQESSYKYMTNKLGDINNIIKRWENGESLRKIADSLNTDVRQFKNRIIEIMGEDEYKRRTYLNARHQRYINEPKTA